MILKRLWLASIGLTLITLAFILVNGEAYGDLFWHQLTYDLPASGLMLAILLVGHWLGRRDFASDAWVERLLLELDRQRYAVAIGLWVALCAGTAWIYRNHPLSMDEYAAMFQAKVFAAGAMHGQFPTDLVDYLIPAHFQNQFLMVNRNTGAVFSAYWPGFAILLTPFEWMGIPWACNPTIVAASFLLIARMARELIASPLAASWALLFALASPAFVANGIAYYAMPAHLLFNLWFAWLLLAPSSTRLFGAGLVGGFALVLHNPFPHLVFALPWILWLATRPGERLRNLAWLAGGYLPVVLILGLGWSLWGQQTLREGAQVATLAQAVAASPSLVDRVVALSGGLIRVFNWPDEAIIYKRLGGLAKLWVWSAPLLLLLVWLGARRDQTVGVRLLSASALLTFFAYFTVPYSQGMGWGYRYFHSAWGTLPILAALGVVKLTASAGADIGRTSRQLVLVSLLAVLGANALQLKQINEYVAEHLAQFPPHSEAERQTVMHNQRGYFSADLVQNDPWLRGGKVVFLASRRQEDELLQRYRPGQTLAARNLFGATYVDPREPRP